MSDRLRVATIGAGYFSRFHHEAWSRLDVDLVAVCDKDPEAARRAAAEYHVPHAYDDVEAMLAAHELDLVDIITPPHTHLGYIERVVAEKTAVVCQKPFTENLEQAERAVDAGRRAGVPVIVHENFRFQPWYGQVKAMLEDGAVGRPYQVAFRLRPGDGQGERAYMDRQPYFQQMPRFLVHETAIHLIDVFRYLFGDVDRVFARLARLNPVIKGEDAGFILLEFASGVRGLFDGNRLVDHPARNQRLTMGEMLVEGATAVLRLDGDGGLHLRRQGRRAESPVHYSWQDRGFGGDCVYRLQHHVVEHLTAGTPVFNNAADYLDNLRVERAVYASHASGGTVTPAMVQDAGEPLW